MRRARYLRVLACFIRNGLVRELSFRMNFVITVISEVMWLGMMLIFVEIIFRHTSNVQGWNNDQYLFLLGTHFLITAIFETLFFSNLHRLSELIRTGRLDFILLKPASTQFLVSFERIDYSALANAPLGAFLCIYAAHGLGAHVTAGGVALFALLVISGVITLYSLMFIFCSTSVWLIRQTSVQNMWFYLTSCARYPAEIYRPLANGVLWFVLMFVLPVLIVANLPANVVVRSFHNWLVVYAVGASFAILGLSMLMFRFALRSYRSASS